MEISEKTIGVFYLSKILGLAPYSFVKNVKGKREVKRSIFFSFYSAALFFIMIFLTYRGLLFDANSKMPVRMKSTTSKVVTAMDVSVVVLATASGGICGLVGLQASQQNNKRLNEVDETLSAYANQKKDQIRTYTMGALGLISITGLLAMDIWTWMRVASEMNVDGENAELNVQWYIPFYTLYYILTGLHLNFAHSAFGLGRRYRRLNLALKHCFMNESGVIAGNNNTRRIISMRTVNEVVEKNSINVLENKSENMKSNPLNGKYYEIEKLAFIHNSLGKGVELLSKSYGLAVLFMLVSCLLHLVATAYFLLLEFLASKNVVFSWLQMLWILFHILRLLLIVEPCHVTTVEARQTIRLVCEIDRNIIDPILSNSLRKFWQQLLADNALFSAYGLCIVDRQILTSFSGAIATYLVILIQFQNTSG